MLLTRMYGETQDVHLVASPEQVWQGEAQVTHYLAEFKMVFAGQAGTQALEER